MNPRIPVLYGAFLASGFAGLIYESVWTQYLKLFLGHAAYAQTAVLSIFMGGMAFGAWLAGRYSRRIRNPLKAYALAEGVVAVAALAFHHYFLWASDIFFVDVLPEIASPPAASIVKWTAASLSILPQSILLGMTFPLMSAGVLRLKASDSGNVLASLYLLNSLGAAVGVLAAGFVLVPWSGLPGTLLTAGLINAGVAIAVWLVSAERGTPALDETAVEAARHPLRADGLPRLLLWGAAITGGASFLYEIAWIRMLSLVLGSSTHSFELMLSAFILGIALGGAWVRRRIAGLRNPVVFLAQVQLAMGLLALATLWLYDQTFLWMGQVFGALAPTQGGYALFSIASHGISMAVMVPVTFCAGMTLPLLTELLLRAGRGERAIGQVYAANTLGSIAGILVAVHILMPWVGVHGVMVLGGAADMALGVVLLGAGSVGVWRVAVAAAAALGATGAAAAWGAPAPERMASGVFRGGATILPEGNRVIRHSDGKTATVTLTRTKAGIVALATNGKVDASINMSGKGTPAGDEYTQALAGAIPLLMQTHATKAAVIGMGSGMTTHVLLAAPGLARVDTIEIEAGMAAAAREGFYPLVQRTFDDPRSRVVIDDAKSFLASTGNRYDIIVSEPSNPWVSGVASLFTREFYALAARHLNEGGLLVQWLQGYETNLAIFSSVVRALRETFPAYAIYSTNDVDFIIVARRAGPPPALDGDCRLEGTLAEDLARLGLRSVDALRLRRVGDSRILDPLVDATPVVANSDYFPWVDQNAAKARFMREQILVLTSFGLSRLPLLELLGVQDALPSSAASADDAVLSRAVAMRQAAAVRRGILSGDWEGVDVQWQRRLAFLRMDSDCPRMEEALAQSIVDLADVTTPYLTPAELAPMWDEVARRGCLKTPNIETAAWLGLVRALSNRDPRAAAGLAEALLAESRLVKSNSDLFRHAFLAATVGRIASGEPARASANWDRHAARIYREKPVPAEAQLAGALIGRSPPAPAAGQDPAAGASPASVSP
jgi:predicted membrane-bound spermidine synthase